MEESPRGAGRPPLERLLIGVAVLAVVAFAIHQYAARREQARLDGMRTALQRLALAQESWRYDHGVYAAHLDSLVARGYGVPGGVRIEITEATVHGWSAAATHGGTVVGCFLYVGDAAPVGIASRMGAVRCG